MWQFVSEVLLQAKVIRDRPLAGIAHAFVFWGFCAFALITLDPDVAPAFEQQHGHDALLAEVERGIEAANEQLARVEQIKKFKLLDEEWQPGGDELTPTMKLKRKPINEKYEREIEALYA